MRAASKPRNDAAEIQRGAAAVAVGPPTKGKTLLLFPPTKTFTPSQPPTITVGARAVSLDTRDASPLSCNCCARTCRDAAVAARDTGAAVSDGEARRMRDP